MKQYFLLLFIITALSSKAQDTARIDSNIWKSSIRTFAIDSSSMFIFEKPKSDTVKAVFLITTCDNCSSKSVTGFIVRNTWDVLGFLDIKKKPFPSYVTIWNYKIKTFSAKAQDTSYFRIGNVPDYGKIDTFYAHCLVQAGPHWDKRKVVGFVILKETPKGCRRIGFLTIYKKPFPRRFKLITYELF